MIAANGLREFAAGHFLAGQFAAGAQATRQCLQLQPQQSQHFVRKALYEVQASNFTAAVADLHKAIANDDLNHHAYYNLAVLQMREGDLEGAFKNLCCCLSVGHLLRAEREDSLEEVEAAIEYCFNNKEARMLKSILKLRAGKNIEALNQINYALYLAPSHPHLKTLQETVYRAVGMKEFKPKTTPFHKPKYDRLETNKEVPPANRIRDQIDKLMKEYNCILKYLDNSDVYAITFSQEKERKQDVIASQAAEETKEKKSLKFFLPATEGNKAEFEHQSVSISLKEKEEKESTTNNSHHIQLAKQQSLRTTPMDSSDKPQPFFLLESSLSNLSISNISQNSHVKVNRLPGIELSREENVLDSSLCSQGEVKLPLRLSQLRVNEKIVVTLQRTAVNERGESERVEELYEVVGGNSQLQLVKITK